MAGGDANSLPFPFALSIHVEAFPGEHLPVALASFCRNCGQGASSLPLNSTGAAHHTPAGLEGRAQSSVPPLYLLCSLSYYSFFSPARMCESISPSFICIYDGPVQIST